MENNLKLQMNAKQILAVLGAQLYKGDLLYVAFRELFQNSFDAVKKSDRKIIQVFYTDCNSLRPYYTLSFKDTGCGMTPEMVVNHFFTVGGTFKDRLDPSERSGGFGIAKVQYLMASSNVRIETSRDGIKTIATATQEELLEGRGHIETQPCEKDAHGTDVTLTFPSSYMVNGEKQRLNLSPYWAEQLFKYPLIGYENVETYYNNSLRKRTDISKMQKITMNPAFGTTDLYADYNVRDGNYTDIHVYCAGLFQFTYQIYTPDASLVMHMNVHPSYVGGDDKYAFANSRDTFSHFAKSELDRLQFTQTIKDLCETIKLRNAAAQFAEYATLTYTDVQASELERTITGSSNEKPIDISELLRNIDDWNSFFTKILEIKTKEQEVAKATAEAKENGKDVLIRLINKDNKILTKETLLLINKVASIVYDAIYDINIRPEFRDRIPTVAGCVIDATLSGCFLTLNGTSGVYLNPTGTFYNANHFANSMMETLLHELAHTHSSEHYGSFFEEEDRLRKLFWKKSLYEKYHAKFLKAWEIRCSE
jgi:hypothetical protein